jgi:hypothetical protein
VVPFAFVWSERLVHMAQTLSNLLVNLANTSLQCTVTSSSAADFVAVGGMGATGTSVLHRDPLKFTRGSDDATPTGDGTVTHTLPLIGVEAEDAGLACTADIAAGAFVDTGTGLNPNLAVTLTANYSSTTAITVQIGSVTPGVGSTTGATVSSGANGAVHWRSAIADTTGSITITLTGSLASSAGVWGVAVFDTTTNLEVGTRTTNTNVSTFSGIISGRKYLIGVQVRSGVTTKNTAFGITSTAASTGNTGRMSRVRGTRVRP